VNRDYFSLSEVELNRLVATLNRDSVHGHLLVNDAYEVECRLCGHATVVSEHAQARYSRNGIDGADLTLPKHDC
jgi:hypothetical protein